MIEKIACPKYNIANKGNFIEVFVNFDANGNPSKIMCEEYCEKTGKCGLENAQCIFNQWKDIRNAYNNTDK